MLDFILGMRSPLEWKNTHNDDILILLTPICVCVCVCVCVRGGWREEGAGGTPIPSLVSLARFSPQILNEIQTGSSQFPDVWSSNPS